ncbi:MAG: hypothetical protein LC791_08230, partial [Acidobacteria bacterium]|nr:hypothetical protein [Acidobacteriota bacterium]
MQTVFEQARAIDFEQLDVDDHFGARLVDGADNTTGRRDPLRRVLDGDGVGRRQCGEAPGIDDDAQDVDRLLEIGIAQVERPHQLVFVLAPLGWCIGHDDDCAGRGHFPEAACGGR